MKRSLIPAVALLSVLATPLANAITISSSTGGAPTGANLVNFDKLPLGNGGGTATGPSGTVNVSFTGDAKAVQGALGGQYAAPVLSGSNGTGFGAPNQVNGTDATTYLTTGVGTVTLTFGSLQSYFGILWGSVDTYNTLYFYKGTSLVDTVPGNLVALFPTGDQGVNGTKYVNIDTTSPYDTVVAASGNYAFEFDNVAYSPLSLTVPDGGVTAGMLGVSLAGLAFLRRKLA